MTEAEDIYTASYSEVRYLVPLRRQPLHFHFKINEVKVMETMSLNNYCKTDLFHRSGRFYQAAAVTFSWYQRVFSFYFFHQY